MTAEGKCARPLRRHGAVCNAPAWGEQYTKGSAHSPFTDENPGPYGEFQPYIDGLACPSHGGPRKDQVRFVRDGNMWCAFLPDFKNLQESTAGFGVTQDAAEAALNCAVAEETV